MLDVIRAGTTYSLDDGTYCWFVGDAGWGMSPAHRLLERGPLQHGQTDRGFRLDPRTGTLVLFIQGTSRQDLYDKRDTLLRIFQSAGDAISLRWTLDDVRQVDCFYSGDMGMSSDNRPGFNQRLAVTLLAPDPTFYDPAGADLTFDLGGGGDALEVPTVVPLTVGSSDLDSINAVEYDGSWLTYPHLIRITGPITDPIVTNETTGEVLDFDGITIAGGTYYDINLLWGVKSVKKNDGTNKIAELTEDSDLATWHIAADPEAIGGANSIRVTGSSVTESTRVEISYFERFIGR